MNLFARNAQKKKAENIILRYLLCHNTSSLTDFEKEKKSNDHVKIPFNLYLKGAVA